MVFGTYAALCVSAYLLGSIPTGFLVGKARGMDIRKVGSGNIGATNTFRALGVPAGVLVLIIDGLKGYVACVWLTDLVVGLTRPGAQVEYFRIAAGISALLGHNYTCWLRFKGGKGIATSAGVQAALVPLALLAILGIWGVTFLASRYVSLASLLASFSLPFAALLTGSSLRLVLVTAAMSALAIYKHKSNIRRLLKGTENRVGTNKTEVTR